LREKLRVPARLVEEAVALLRGGGEVVRAAELLEVKLRDRSDVAVLSDAVAGRAEILVTADRDLRAVTGKLPLRILTLRQFWQALRDV